MVLGFGVEITKSGLQIIYVPYPPLHEVTMTPDVGCLASSKERCRSLFNADSRRRRKITKKRHRTNVAVK